MSWRDLRDRDWRRRQFAAERARVTSGGTPVPTLPIGMPDDVARRLAHRLLVRRLDAYSAHTLERRGERGDARDLVDGALLSPSLETLRACRVARFADRVLDGIVRGCAKPALETARLAWELALASGDTPDQLRADLESVGERLSC